MRHTMINAYYYALAGAACTISTALTCLLVVNLSRGSDTLSMGLAITGGLVLELLKFRLLVEGPSLWRQGAKGWGALVSGGAVVCIAVSFAASYFYFDSAAVEHSEKALERDSVYQGQRDQIDGLTASIASLRVLVANDSASYRNRALETQNKIQKLEAQKAELISSLKAKAEPLSEPVINQQSQSIVMAGIIEFLGFLALVLPGVRNSLNTPSSRISDAPQNRVTGELSKMREEFPDTLGDAHESPHNTNCVKPCVTPESQAARGVGAPTPKPNDTINGLSQEADTTPVAHSKTRQHDTEYERVKAAVIRGAEPSFRGLAKLVGSNRGKVESYRKRLLEEGVVQRGQGNRLVAVKRKLSPVPKG